MPQGNNINIVEKHIEKVVLVLCALLLVGAVAMRVIVSPRKEPISPPDPPVSPANMDEQLDEYARKVDQRVKDQPAQPGESFEKYYDAMVLGRQAPWAQKGLEGFTASQPPAVMISDEAKVLHASLPALTRDLFAPDKPKVEILQQLSRRQDTDGKDRAVDSLVAHVVTEYDWQKLRDAWDDKLEAAKTTTRDVVVRLEAQGRLQMPDGRWVDRDVRTVSLWQAQGLTPPTLPAFPAADAADVQAAIADLNGNWRKRLIQSDYWQVYQSNAWTGWADSLGAWFAEGDRDKQVWFHEDGLAFDRPYQYRCRLVLVNPLLSWPDDVPAGSPTDAEQPALTTPWSEWSNPVAAAPTTEFFFQSSTPSQATVRFTVLARAMGQVVSESFKVAPGESIGGVKALQITDPVAGQVRAHDVDFTTGAVLLSVEPDRRVRAGLLVRATPQAIYVDGQGRLQSRYLLIDKGRIPRD
ncbi:MAG: hypothetical protein ACYS8X_05025 [Planctomycetota bacterium]|jgi:hypothetical protein